MKNYIIIIIVFLFFFLIFSSLNFAQSCGVLIGLRHDEILPGPLPFGETPGAARLAKYRTLWISLNEPEPVSIVEISNLIVPRKDGFWKIEVIRQQEGAWVEDCLICVPANQKPTIPPLDSLSVTECEGNKRLALIFVGTDYVSYEGGSDGYCQGAAHPWHVNYLKTVAIDDPTSDGIEISSEMGMEANQALQQGATNYFSRLQDERLNPTPDPKNWGLIRRKGHWVLCGQLDYSSEIYRGQFALFDIPYSPSKKLIGFDQLIMPWEQIQKVIPEVSDAITSPAGNLLIALDNAKLFIYVIDSKSIFKLIKTVDLFPDEFLIMAQWSTGKYIRRWDRIVKQF